MIGAFDHISDDDPRVIEHERNRLMGVLPKSPGLKAYRALQEENVRLKAELEALKPKPVIHEVHFQVIRNSHLHRWEASYGTAERMSFDNLKLTFTDGKLTGAEVL